MLFRSRDADLGEQPLRVERLVGDAEQHELVGPQVARELEVGAAHRFDRRAELEAQQGEVIYAAVEQRAARGDQLLEIIGAAGFKRAVAALGGYEAARAGELLYRQ